MQKKQKKKQYYRQQFQQSKRGEEIKRGITGFLITCDMNKEKRCVKECFNILNDFTARCYPDIADLQEKYNPKKTEVKEETKETGDALKSLESEIEAVKQDSSKIYFVFDMGIPGVIFIKLVDWMLEVIDVKKVGLAIIDHVFETKDPMSRFACRFIPVDFLCKANIADFTKFIEPIIKRTFAADRVLWCMDFKRRCNDKAIRKEYFDVLETQIDRLKHPISFEEAD